MKILLRRCGLAALASVYIYATGTIVASNAIAGTFNCSVVYDEFESLMNRQFLLQPQSYISVAEDVFTRAQYQARQRGVFHLYPNRAKLGVAIVVTNGNLRGKLLLDWQRPSLRGAGVLGIADGVLYGRVKDGYAPRRLARMRIRSGFALDLDNGQQSEVEYDRDGNPRITDDNADVLISGGEQNLQIEAINNARLWFPQESMCLRRG